MQYVNASVHRGFARLAGTPHVYIVYAGGYKVWCRSSAHVEKAQALARFETGVDTKINDFSDVELFAALGPIAGPHVPNVDDWGVPIP